MEKQKRGFALLPPDRLAEIARMGGLAVKPEHRTFSTQRDVAVAAGRKGGAISRGGPKKVEK